jgi:peroxiredoxin
MELNALKKVADRWKNDYDVEIIAVSVDIPQMVGRARKMFETNGWDFTFFHDSKQELMEKLGIQNIPYSMLIDGSGKIQSIQTGYYLNYEKQLEQKIKKL